MTEKKKPKKKSQTAVIKSLRERYQKLDRQNDLLYFSKRKVQSELNEIAKHCPPIYYKIFFNIKNNLGHINKYEEIVKAYSIDHAIEKIKCDKTHPETFELTNVVNLGK